MSTRELPSIDYLRQLVDYDPETGAFTYRHVDAMRATRNSRVAGKPAFARAHRQGYRVGVVCGRQIFAHRAAWALTYGDWPDGEIDHINHDPADNRLANLRAVTKAENMRNMPMLRSNKTGVTGVYWIEETRKWRAAIRVDRKLRHLGSFADFDDAVQARKAAEREFGFHANHGIDAESTA